MAIIKAVLWLYILAILLVVVLSWFPMAPDGVGRKVFDALRRVTDPILQPVRRMLPPVGGAIDLSPTVVLLVLIVLVNALPS